MPPSTLVVVDLGDGFTKAIAVGAGVDARWRFPSVVARRLVRSSRDLRELSLGASAELLRPIDFDPDSFLRTRSYPDADRFVRWLASRPAETAMRFAGGIAAVYGAERQTLGDHPTTSNVDALVHKVLMLLARATGADALSVELVLVVDTGAKAGSIGRWVSAIEPEFELDLRSHRDRTSRRLDIHARFAIVDAPLCATTALPEEIFASGRRILVVDLGHRSSKIAVVSPDGCELQERLFDLGLHECVRSVLRDGQEQRLFEDEYAVMRAIERGSDVIQIAGRRFDVGALLESARTSLEQDLARAVERCALRHFRSRGEICHALAVVGGGASVIGARLAQRVQALLDIPTAWTETSQGFHVAEGGVKWAQAHRWD